MNRINGHDSEVEVERATLEAPRPIKHPYVLRLKGSKSCTLQCYSKNFWGFKIHWVGDHSEPHAKDATKCHWCQRNMPIKERYYLFGWDVDGKQEVFLEFTFNAARAVKKQLPKDCNMRGLGIYLSRTKSDNGRLNVHILNGRLDEKTLKPDRDPIHTLRALWRVKSGAQFHGIEFAQPRPDTVDETFEPE